MAYVGVDDFAADLSDVYNRGWDEAPAVTLYRRPPSPRQPWEGAPPRGSGAPPHISRPDECPFRRPAPLLAPAGVGGAREALEATYTEPIDRKDGREHMKDFNKSFAVFAGPRAPPYDAHTLIIMVFVFVCVVALLVDAFERRLIRNIVAELRAELRAGGAAAPVAR